MAILRYVAVIFALLPSLAFSETIPASVIPHYSTLHPTCGELASGPFTDRYGQVHSRTPKAPDCQASYPAGFVVVAYCQNPWGSVCGWDATGYVPGPQYYCPSGQNWTLSGDKCTRPDCVPPQERDPQTGQCLATACQSGESETGSFFAGWRVGLGADQVIGSDGGAFTFNPNRCQNGCAVNVTVSGCTASAGYVDTPVPITCTGTGTKTGARCTSEDTGTPTTTPTVPHHRPKCNAGEGVLTTSSGTVACVPPGTPASAPVVRTEKQNQQFPDGSSKTIETTYTKDPVSQVQDTQQTITNTPAAGGGVGQAGPVGSTAGSSSVQPSSPTDKEASDFCKANGQLQICKGDMNKEETQKQVLEALKPTEPADKSALDAALADKAAEDAHKAKFEDIGARGQSDENGWFAWAMIPEVPPGSCVPMTGQFMGRTIQFDWCDELEKVRSIAGYAFYIVTAFAMFSIFTGAFGRKS